MFPTNFGREAKTFKMSNTNCVTAIILAAGSGSRMVSKTTKQRLNLLGESVLFRSVKSFESCDKINGIIVVTREEEVAWASEELASFSKVKAIIPGGKTRAESARIGFMSVPQDADFVAIHDGARCLVTPENISDVVSAAIVHGAATAGTFITDTVKKLSGEMIEGTIPRDCLFSAQTPQVFAYKLYEKALRECRTSDSITDDNMLLEAIGIKVCPVNTGKHNIKLTTTEDMELAEFLLERRKLMTEIRVGQGYDVHRMTEGRKLVLGGVEIPYEKGLLGHSDADVLTHAIMDALLGAAGLGDIGRHFPDNDQSYRNISSLILLKNVSQLISEVGYTVVNIDATVVLQAPKIAGYIDSMIQNISDILSIERGRVNIKATTEEHLGFTGSGEGVAAHAVATVKK